MNTFDEYKTDLFCIRCRRGTPPNFVCNWMQFDYRSDIKFHCKIFPIRSLDSSSTSYWKNVLSLSRLVFNGRHWEPKLACTYYRLVNNHIISHCGHASSEDRICRHLHQREDSAHNTKIKQMGPCNSNQVYILSMKAAGIDASGVLIYTLGTTPLIDGR